MLLLDPMLGAHSLDLMANERRGSWILLLSATGGSAIKAVEVLKESGVPEEKIIFINLVRPSLPSFLPPSPARYVYMRLELTC